jgi:hypothetical protein
MSPESNTHTDITRVQRDIQTFNKQQQKSINQKIQQKRRNIFSDNIYTSTIFTYFIDMTYYP